MKRHVLVLPSFLECKWSGGGTFFREQAVIMSQLAGWEINMLMPCAQHVLKIRRRKLLMASGIEIEKQNGIEIWLGFYPYYLPRKNRQAWKYFGEELFLQYVKKHGMPELIWAHAILNAGYLAQHLSKKYGVPYFIHEHLSMYLKQKMSGFLCHRVKSVIDGAVYCAAVGEKLRLAMLRQTGAEEDKICIIYNPVGFEFTDVTLPKHDFPPSPFIFVSTAYMRAEKNINKIIQAFAMIVDENKNVRLIIGGNGNEENKLKNLAKDMHIMDYIEFVGKQNRQQIYELLMRANAFVAASDYESCGVALLEALSCGLPAITTKVGIAEKIINHENGILIESPTDKNIASAMRVILERNYEHADIQASAMAKFHPKIFAQQVQDTLCACERK
ncbi:Glycosyl transferase, group 1 [uncultured Candidatus Thioglobus sp.]|nr:Glycosyl transferase, group 1 [uncultured Candidatus Thioglobus sp.]